MTVCWVSIQYHSNTAYIFFFPHEYSCSVGGGLHAACRKRPFAWLFGFSTVLLAITTLQKQCQMMMQYDVHDVALSVLLLCLDDIMQLMLFYLCCCCVLVIYCHWCCCSICVAVVFWWHNAIDTVALSVLLCFDNILLLMLLLICVVVVLMI